MGADENGGLDPHKMRRMRREFSLPGRYRKLMNRFLAAPSVEVRAYADDLEQMHPTDLDDLKAAAAAATKTPGGKRSREDAADGEPTSKKAKVEDEVDMKDADEAAPTETDTATPVVAATPEPMRIAAVVKFQLGRSAYATVALRELMGDPPEEVI
ncbi:hypothetical protein G7046_g9895 [Stylonectria norvegica]|nr:hypothetical protein G7046_g9895 [Stylonectria norvegica]